MNIIVCVKQVPATTEVLLNPETNTIIREGVESMLNPFDTYAIEEALRLRARCGSGRVTVLSMGIPSVAQLLKETLALGVDAAVLLSDRKFAGADSLATAHALASGIGKIGPFDLIICGKQATDGDTAQVGPSLAEKLGIPHTTYVRKTEALDELIIRCERQTDEGYDLVEMDLPAVITVLKGINVPRLPSIKGMRQALQTEVQVWGAADVGADENNIGLNGSPTQVARTFVPSHTVAGEILVGTLRERASRLVGILENKGLLPREEQRDE